jgi:hypothetical protein
MQFKIVDLESRLRSTTKSLEEKSKELERTIKEKNEAQCRQFLL